MSQIQVTTKFEHCYITRNEFLEKDYRKIEEIFKRLNEDENTNFLFTNQGIKLNQYVGLIEYDENKYIEILPKLYDDGSCSENLPQIAKEQGRKILTKLLMVYLGVEPRVVYSANLNYGRFSLWDIIIYIFVNEVSKIIKQGLKKKYVKVRNNSRYLKGRLLVSQHIRKNAFNQTKFFIEYEELSADIPENRILKTTLNYLKRYAISEQLRRQINNLLFNFDEINFSININRDLQSIYIDRTFSHYDYAIRLARIFLRSYSFSNVIQNNNQREQMMSLLFDMNRLFESYVAYILKTKYGYPIITQATGLHLAYDSNQNRSIFQLRPDIYLETNEKICILDTKWKKISNNRGNDNYGISQSDMYQMLAYAVRYTKEKNKPVKIFLIYPKYNQFSNPINLSIDTPFGRIPINIIPFDLKRDSISLNNC